MGVCKASKYVKLVYKTIIYYSDRDRRIQEILCRHIYIYIFFIYQYVLVSAAGRAGPACYRLSEL